MTYKASHKNFFTKIRWGQVFLHLAMAFLLICMIYPLLMSVWCAFKTINQYDISKFYPTLPLKMMNLKTAWGKISVYVYNTIAVAFFGIIGSSIIASMASFAFARMDFPGRTLFFTMVLCLMMIPGVLTLVPQFLLYKDLHLNDKLIALLIPQLTMQPIGAVFLLSMFFKGLPQELFDSAKIDGANDFQVFSKIAVPLSMPILITQAIMQMNGIWNDYLWPMTIISTNYEALTISSGLIVEFRNLYSQNMPVTYAGYLLSSIPLLIVFIFGNKYYIRGLLGSSIKM
ncbi:MAG: carbohydrate ABC transporter permease [Candidatus Caccosoma sp.]|nr:carbohydrate ABC transporter permease [Candidatus Caccosoma sp.]